MIKAGEIQKIASELGVRDTQIEKDYVIGWILKGISQNPFLSEYLVFKGGTVLKKVWFGDYRFSEDLDFTFHGSVANWDIAKIESGFKSVCDWVYEESRIKLSLNPDDGSADQYRGYLAYQGPLGGEKNIKIDISTNELITYDVKEKVILDPYSDAEDIYQTKAYSLEESLAEKLRCTIQRTIPRDVYDIWYLTEEAGIDIESVAFGFQDKTIHKEIDPKKILEVLKSKEKKYKVSWENSLNHQVKDLPIFDEVWREVMRSVKKMVDLLNS